MIHSFFPQIFNSNIYDCVLYTSTKYKLFSSHVHCHIPDNNTSVLYLFLLQAYCIFQINMSVCLLLCKSCVSKHNVIYKNSYFCQYEPDKKKVEQMLNWTAMNSNS